MLASSAPEARTDDLVNPRVVFEPKYDGMRVLALVEPAEPTPRVTLRSRQGNDKTAQFPDLVRDLRRFARALRAPVLLDGEVVALDARGQPTTFQRLAGRIHLTGSRSIEEHAGRQSVAFIAFDLLRDGSDDLRGLPLVDRKARLEKVFGTAGSERVRLAEMAAGDGRRLHDRAVADGWEGLIAKDAHSVYEAGRRSPAWRKLKLPRRQELVVGGWTDPRETRQHFGSLAVGYYEGRGRSRALQFAGLVGSGFSQAELARLAARLADRHLDECPFAPHTALPRHAHWVRPDLVVEVKFTEWTDEGLLRHPVYLGERADKAAHSVAREDRGLGSMARATAPQSGVPRPRDRTKTAGFAVSESLELVAAQIQALEDAGRDGTILLPDGARLDVTNLRKLFWPGLGITKGDLLRYYARVSPLLLPVLEDRPLVMKRFPNGIAGKTFYQQRAPDEVQAGVRVEVVEGDPDAVPRVIGGSLQTLLYTAQLAAISLDPWFSRVGSVDDADYVALDLDPMPGVPFSQVLEVARAIREVLLTIDVVAVPKTSGSSGLHVYIPLAAGTPYASGQLFCQIIATLVASRHASIATVERAVAKRGKKVYVDYLQNIVGKALATAYSVRASEFAGVSTPLRWEELDEDVHPEDFTIRNALERVREAGDLWASLHRGPRNDLRAVLERLR
jgi:bifunctional non-homologous end joining protein LigD